MATIKVTDSRGELHYVNADRFELVESTNGLIRLHLKNGEGEKIKATFFNPIAVEQDS